MCVKVRVQVRVYIWASKALWLKGSEGVRVLAYAGVCVSSTNSCQAFSFLSRIIFLVLARDSTRAALKPRLRLIRARNWEFFYPGIFFPSNLTKFLVLDIPLVRLDFGFFQGWIPGCCCIAVGTTSRPKETSLSSRTVKIVDYDIS